MVRSGSSAILFAAVLSVLAIGPLSTADEKPDTLETARRLTDDGLLKRDPFFWPGGKELIYTVEDAGTGRMRVIRLQLETAKSESFHGKRDLSDRELSASADGKVYAYNVVSGLSSKIVVEDGERSRKVTIPQIAINWCNWPSVSPDGTTVVFTEGAAAIYSYDLIENKGKESIKRLTVDGVGYSDLWPKFSPDGARLVFASRRDNDFEIYVMNASGSGQTRLTKSKGIDARPVFSPDGKRIAFTSNRDGNYEIYVMAADGSDPRRVTEHPERDDHPCWHPDGKSLVIVSERDGRFDLYRVDVPGSS